MGRLFSPSKFGRGQSEIVNLPLLLEKRLSVGAVLLLNPVSLSSKSKADSSRNMSIRMQLQLATNIDCFDERCCDNSENCLTVKMLHDDPRKGISCITVMSMETYCSLL